MAQGRQEHDRMCLVAQAALVWGVGEMSPSMIEEFIVHGTLGRTKGDGLAMSPELARAVAQKIDEIVAHGNKLIV
jgi:hypothetical protein